MADQPKQGEIRNLSNKPLDIRPAIQKKTKDSVEWSVQGFSDSMGPETISGHGLY